MSAKEPEENTTESNKKSKTDATVIVATIGAISTIVVAILGLPPLIAYIDSKLNPTPTAASTQIEISLPSETPLIVQEYSPAATETITPYPTLPPPTSTETSLETMKVELSASAGSVKLGSTVNFNARNSYVTFADGSNLTCVNHSLCTFSWTIYHQETSSRTYITSDGFLSHAFDKRGNYAVTVYVCRGDACNFASTAVSVR